MGEDNIPPPLHPLTAGDKPLRRTTSRPEGQIRRTTSHKADGQIKKQFSITAATGNAASAAENGNGVVPAAPEGPRQYRAAAFNSPDLEGSMKRSIVSMAAEENRQFQPYKRERQINWFGLLAFIAYIGAFGFYLWIRITKTLDLGNFVWYGWLVLIVEIIGSSTIVLYGVNLLFNPVMQVYEEDAARPGKSVVHRPYHVRCLVPCYKESLEILRRTIMALYDAYLPEGCTRTIYLLDDGKDPKKRKWVDSLGTDVVYVSGRKRPPGEMNGKSGNLNNVCAQLYPKGTHVPGTELVAVFDADQVASKEFFLKTLPLFDGGDDVGMVLSPQCFHNLNVHCDIFNHSNVHFWEYMQPGYDALGFISCTGTNFLVRSNAFLEVGGSPTWTLTEDFALGMEMKKYGWHCRYVQEYLAIGEAPDQIRNCYQQRSRWCKGHFQIFFSKNCPLVQKRLSWFMRIMYISGVWSYIVGAIATPLFIAIPIVTVFFGVFPIVISRWAALGLTVYFIATNAVLYYVRSLKHIEALWFSNVANALLWWTYIKAFWRAINSICGQKIQFKTTLKGASMLMNSALRDLAVPGLCFFLLLASLITGIVKLIQSSRIDSPLAISILWCVYQMIPSGLVLMYAWVSRGMILQYACRLGIILSFFTGACAVALMWGLYPPSYDFGSVAKASTFFYDAQRVGVLPNDNQVPWRGNALVGQLGPDNRDMTGGFLVGGAIGNVQHAMPSAFATSMLAWGLLTFPDGYRKAGATNEALSSVKWGADWLVKCIGLGTNGTSNKSSIVYQMGNYTTDFLVWTRPEELDPVVGRPYYTVSAEVGGSDLAGVMSGALTASALAWRERDFGLYQRYMGMSTTAYQFGKKFTGLYHRAQEIESCPTDFAEGTVGTTTSTCPSLVHQINGSAIPFYNSTTYADKMLWAAAWLYRATGDEAYFQDVNMWYLIHVYQETAGPNMLATDWSNYFWAANVLLATVSDQSSFHSNTQYNLKQWICSYQQRITYTPRGRAFNYLSPTLGGTANTAFLALTYAKFIRQQRRDLNALQKRYVCWGRSQLRYMLGDGGRSFVGGFGENPPTRIQNQAASCPPAPATCNKVVSLISSTPNPHILYGALIEGPGFQDNYEDIRSLNGSRSPIDNNAGFQSALVGLAEAPGSWEQCLQGYGVLTKDKTVCSGPSSFG